MITTKLVGVACSQAAQPPAVPVTLYPFLPYFDVHYCLSRQVGPHRPTHRGPASGSHSSRFSAEPHSGSYTASESVPPLRRSGCDKVDISEIRDRQVKIQVQRLVPSWRAFSTLCYDGRYSMPFKSSWSARPIVRGDLRGSSAPVYTQR